MDGQLAHALATSLWGDRWLSDPASIDLTGFENENSTAGLVATVTFVDPVGAELRSLDAWVRELRRQGAGKLRFVLGDEAPGYGLYADGPAPTVWVPSWGIGNFGDPSGQIWAVRYSAQLLDEELEDLDVSVEDASESLQAAVARCRAFCAVQLLDGWEQTFADAARALKATYPTVAGYPDLVPTGTPNAVRRLVAGAALTHVSGPMDAWPQLRFDDSAAQREFAQCAEQLEIATDLAFVAATGGIRRGRLSRTTPSPSLVRRILPKRGKPADPDETAQAS